MSLNISLKYEINHNYNICFYCHVSYLYLSHYLSWLNHVLQTSMHMPDFFSFLKIDTSDLSRQITFLVYRRSLLFRLCAVINIIDRHYEGGKFQLMDLEIQSIVTWFHCFWVLVTQNMLDRKRVTRRSPFRGEEEVQRNENIESFPDRQFRGLAQLPISSNYGHHNNFNTFNSLQTLQIHQLIKPMIRSVCL